MLAHHGRPMGLSQAGALLVLLLLLSQAAGQPQQQRARARPVLRMAQDFVQLTENQTAAVELGVQLVGAPTAPVRAWLSLSTGQNASGWLEEEVDAWLAPSELSWAAGESGLRTLKLRSALELLEGLEESAVYVRIGSAAGADIEELRDATLLALGPRPAGPEFRFEPNQVAYPSATQQPRLPVRLVGGGELAAPATVRYTITLLTPPPAQQFLPSRAMSGFLVFQPGGPSTLDVLLPVVWSRVPPEAEYRLGLELEGMWDVRVQNQTDAVALHLFGVPSGTCPPGSVLAGAVSNSSSVAGYQQQQQQLGTEAAAEAQHGLSGWATIQGGEDLFILVNGSLMQLSGRSDSSSRSYGAMVDVGVQNVTMCVRRTESLASINVTGSEEGRVQEIESNVGQLCGCGTVFNGTVRQAANTSGNQCDGFRAYLLSLGFGQNLFNLTLRTETNSSKSGSRSFKSGSSGRNSSSEQYSLAVVRLADPAHAEMASLALRSSDGTSVLLCGSAAQQQVKLESARGQAGGGTEANSSGPLMLKALRVNLGEADLDVSNEGGDSSSSSNASSGAATGSSSQLDAMQELLAREHEVAPLLPGTKPCMAGVVMSVNVSYATEMITLTPSLMFPGERGVRVEVNGQVLSRSGDMGADQAQDTTAQLPDNSSAPLPFLPAAFFMGLKPGVEVNIQVVVVAEDGVTSLRYPVTVTRLPNPAPPPAPYLGPPRSPSSSSGWIEAGAVVTYEQPVSSAEQRRKGWPTAPAEQDTCTVCPAGWASAAVNSSQCSMCPPGTYAEQSKSPRCLPCRPGSYAYSWGSSHCKHCIAGTFAPGGQSSLCTMCPANWTNVEDGQAACRVRATPAVDYSQRYAVLVSFNVYLSGLDPENVLLKSGVNAPLEQIVGSLIQSDTASAFNISLQDVTVQTDSTSHVQQRRSLRANVTAALGVDLPEGATEEDIAAALEVQKMSADKPIEMLSQDPDRFFGRTTRTLEVEVQSGNAAAVENWPSDSRTSLNPLFLLLPGAAAVVVGAALVGWACRRSPRCRGWWAAQWRRVAEHGSRGASAAWQLPTAAVRSLGRSAQRYAHYS